MRTARTSLVVSVLSVGVTAVGFANQLIIARTFGTSRALDEFLQATSLPVLVAGAFGGLFAYAMIPALIRATSDSETPEQQTTAFFTAILAIAALVTAGGALAAPWMLRVFAPAAVGGPSADLILAIARVGWLAAGVSVIVAFAGSVLNLRARFILPVALSAFPYLGMFVAVLIRGQSSGAMVLVWGLALGNVAAAVILLYAARQSFSVRALSHRHFAHVRTFVANAPLALLAALTFTVYQTIDAFWAPRLGPSNLSVLGYCQRMLMALGSIMASGPSVVLQPRLASAVARGDEEAFQSDLGRGLRLTILICAPAATGISLLAHPIIRFAFERGAFTRASTVAVASLLPWMLAGMVPMVCTVMLFKALYAKVDTRTATVLGVSGPVLYFAASGALMTIFGLNGIGMAYLATWIVIALVGTYRLSSRRSGRGGIRPNGPFLRELALVTAAAAVPALLLRHTIFADWASLPTPALAIRLAVAAAVGVGSYLTVALLVARVEDFRLLVHGLRQP